MGKTPDDLNYTPEVGYVLEVSYDVNLGVNEEMKGKATGEVTKIFGDDEFLGFRLEVRKANHGDDVEEIDVKANNPQSDLNVYARDNNGKEYKVNAVPGAVTIEEVL